MSDGLRLRRATEADIARGLACCAATGRLTSDRLPWSPNTACWRSKPPKAPTTCWRESPRCAGAGASARRRHRRAGQGAEARSGPPRRPAYDRAAHGRATARRRACRHRGAWRASVDHRRAWRAVARAADNARISSSSGVRATGRIGMHPTAGRHDSSWSPREEFGRRARRRADAALAAAARRPVAFAGVGGRAHGRAGHRKPVRHRPSLSIVGFGADSARNCRLSCAASGETADAVMAAAARRADHHRQPGLHPPGRAPRARGRAGYPDRQLCAADGLGLAAVARARDAPLVDEVLAILPFEPHALRAARRPALHLCGPSPDRDATDLRPTPPSAPGARVRRSCWCCREAGERNRPSS